MVFMQTNRVTLQLSFFKLCIVAILVAYIVGDNSSFSCSSDGDWGDCDAICPWDDHSVGRSCSVEASCFAITYLLILALYVVEFATNASLAVWFVDFDPQLEMIEISKRRDVNSTTLSSLLHPALCLLSISGLGAVGIAAGSFNDTYVLCNYQYFYPWNWVAKLLIAIFIITMEAMTPNLILTMNEYINDGIFDIVSLVRLDLMVVCNFLRLMHLFTWPAGILSWFSIRKREHERKEAPHDNLLTMDVREDFTMHTLGGGAAEDEEWSIVRIARKLCSRYTVQYSFVKLVASIIISMTLNQSYTYCSNASAYMTAAQCPDGCTAHGIFPVADPYTDDAALTDYGQSCAPGDGYTSMVKNSCFCDNWVMTDFLAMFFNTVHFVLQCAYLIRYNNFDPQQNQIDCVQSYTFVGENITLFLTHPAICFLSVLESGVLAVSWIAVVMNLGLTCAPTVENAPTDEGVGSSLLFALFMTLIEVYKANMTVATNALRERQYFWAAFSLIRVDLFVFYGSTLFLQTFLFPFSIVGYVATLVHGRYDPLTTEGDIDGLPIKRGSSAGVSVGVADGDNEDPMTTSLLDAESKSVDVI